MGKKNKRYKVLFDVPDIRNVYVEFHRRKIKTGKRKGKYKGRYEIVEFETTAKSGYYGHKWDKDVVEQNPSLFKLVDEQ